MKKTLICGLGIVGKHIKQDFPFAETYDPQPKQKADYTRPPKDLYDFAFIAVPTPDDNGKCNIAFVEQAISEVNAKIFILKSTVPPTTTETLRKKYNKRIIFSPEFYGLTQFADANPDFAIFGCNDEDYHEVRQFYELVKGADFKFYHCNSTEAEIIKYMENSFLGLKVIFCNQFKDIADLYGVSYSNIRDGLILDHRIGPSHTYVFDEYRGYDSKCLNKDIPAIVSAVKERGFDKPFIMETVDKINSLYRKNS